MKQKLTENKTDYSEEVLSALGGKLLLTESFGRESFSATGFSLSGILQFWETKESQETSQPACPTYRLEIKKFVYFFFVGEK